MRIPDPIRVHARVTPDEIAFIHDDVVVTYQQLDVAISRVQDQLEDANISSGQCVGFVAGSDVFKTIVSIWAVLRCGSIAFPMSHRLPPESISELSVAAQCLMISPAGEHGDLVLDWERTTEPTTGVIYLDTERRATILATSGSSGLPKLAVHKLESHLYSAWDSYVQIPLVRGDRWLLSIPLNHVGGLAILFRSFLSGTTVVASESKHLARTIETHGVTHASLVSTQLKRLVDDAGSYRSRSLKSVLVGGGAVHPSLLQGAIDSGLPIRVTYGMTESSSQIATTPVLTGVNVSKDEPIVMRHVAVRVRNGIIQIKGPNLFEGYLRNGTVLDERDAGGWFSTGDMGAMENGRLRVTGRVDNMFVSGGENIQPEEIEHYLVEVSGIDRALVVPVPDAEFGWRPVAFVAGLEKVDRDVLSMALARRLPRYKVPIRYYVLPDQYLHISKIDRQSLQKEAIRRIGVEK